MRCLQWKATRLIPAARHAREPSGCHGDTLHGEALTERMHVVWYASRPDQVKRFMIRPHAKSMSDTTTMIMIIIVATSWKA